MQYDVIVIGSGPGGYVSAIRCAQLGLKTAVIEKYSTFGGTCLNVGCIPSKALISVAHRYEQAKHSEDMGVIVSDVELDFSKVQAFKDSVVKKLTGGVAGLLKGNNVDTLLEQIVGYMEEGPQYYPRD